MRGYVLPVVVASPPVVVTRRCISLYMLALGLTKFEALYMITVFEGFMIISGAISGAWPRSRRYLGGISARSRRDLSAASHLIHRGAPRLLNEAGHPLIVEPRVL